MLLTLLLACPAPPTQPVATIFPPEPTTTDVLEANTSTPSTDPNGDPVSYRYAWFVDDTPAEGQSGATVAPEATAKGQVWKVLITPTDGFEDGETGYSGEVTILNSAPTVEVELGETLSTQDLTPTLSIADADADELTTTISWTVGGEDAGISEASVPASATSSGQIWAIRVLVDDGQELAEASASVVIGNTLPSIDAVVLGPEPASVADLLELAISASDDDGDPLEPVVSWFVGGVELAEAGLTLSSEHFVKGDEVYALATVSDGFASPEAVESNHLEIGNAPPPEPGVSLTPEDPHQDLDDLVCIWSAEEVDEDGEDLALSVTWDVDGEAYDSPTRTWFDGDTIPAGVGLEGETWTCTVSLDDGEDVSSAQASSEVLFACSDEGAFDTSDDSGPLGDPSARVVDVDGDGHLDVMLCEDSGDLQVHWGSGTGGFGSLSSPPFGASADCPAVGDFDGDGYVDLVWVTADSTQVQWTLGDGTRNFGGVKNTSHTEDASRVALVDGNLDGSLDLLYTSEDLGCLAIRFAGGGGALQASSCLTSQTGPFRAADLDGSGADEIVQIAEGDLKVYGFDPSGGGTLTDFAVLDTPGLEELIDLDLADVDADGDLDVLAWGLDADDRLLLARYLGDGSGDASTFRECQVAVVDEAPGGAGDLDEDGLPDMVTVAGCTDCSSTWTTHLLQ